LSALSSVKSRLVGGISSRISDLAPIMAVRRSGESGPRIVPIRDQQHEIDT
jgi:hypothetical protein